VDREPLGDGHIADQFRGGLLELFLSIIPLSQSFQNTAHRGVVAPS
jgi:hypothetical protein